MTQFDEKYLIHSKEQLVSLFGDPGEAAVQKEVSFLHPHYQSLIKASPFAVLATIGPSGLDASPRGDPPGFVSIQDKYTLLIPERRGNNRIDSLLNILTDPRVALLFLIPGVGETLRVNGRARITTDPEILKNQSVEGKLPKCVIIVKVETAFFQCARAIQRSRLWQPVSHNSKPDVPSAGTILEALTNANIDGGKYDGELPARQRDTLY